MIWRIEHVGDFMWKMTSRQDIRYREEASTAVMKVEFDEKVHHRLFRRPRPEKLQSRRAGDLFFGNMLRTGEVIIGTKNGVRKY